MGVNVMTLFRSSDEAEDLVAKRQFRRYRSGLVVSCLLLYFLFLWWENRVGWTHMADAFIVFPIRTDGLPGGSPFLLPFAVILTAPGVLLLILSILAIMNLLDRFHVKLRIICLATPILGALLTYGFFKLCFTLWLPS